MFSVCVRACVCLFCFLLSYAAMYTSDVHPLSLRVFICTLRNIRMPLGQRCSISPAPSDAAFAEHRGAAGAHKKSHLLSEGRLVCPAASSLHCIPRGLVTAQIDRLHDCKFVHPTEKEEVVYSLKTRF